MMGVALSAMLEEKKEEEQAKAIVLIRNRVKGDLHNVKVQGARHWTAGKKDVKIDFVGILSRLARDLM